MSVQAINIFGLKFMFFHALCYCMSIYSIVTGIITNEQFDKTEKIGFGKKRSVSEDR